MICPTSPLSSSPTGLHFTCSVSTTPGYLLFLVDVKCGFISGSLYLLFPLQETLFLQTATWPSTTLYSVLCSYVISSKVFPDHSVLNNILLLSFSLSPVLFLFSARIITWYYVIVRLYLICQLHKNLNTTWAEVFALFAPCMVIPRT